MRILIIKQGALGDVLRTTALLEPLRRLHPQADIWWLTASEARPLLDGNPELDRIITGRYRSGLSGVRFDWVLSMEENRVTAGLSRKLSYGRWTGVIPTPDGLGYTPDSAPYYAMSLLNRDDKGRHDRADRLKQANRAPFEDLWMRVLGADRRYRMPKPLLALSDGELQVGERLIRGLGAHEFPVRIGINPSSGKRWPSKRIPEDSARMIGRRIKERWGFPALLLGGPDERSANSRLARSSKGDLLDTGRHPIRRFAALVAQCDVVVTSDSLALHVANALSRPVVAAFGPTSPHEVSLTCGVKISPPGGCDCWYHAECTRKSPCLSRIPRQLWMDAIHGLLPASAKLGPLAQVVNRI